MARKMTGCLRRTFQPQIRQKKLDRKHEYPACQHLLKFSPHQPMPAPHGVLRLNSLFQHMDWVENLAIHPCYVTQAAFRARAVSTCCSGPAPIAMFHFTWVLKYRRAALRRHVGVSPCKEHGKEPFVAVGLPIKAELRRPAARDLFSYHN